MTLSGPSRWVQVHAPIPLVLSLAGALLAEAALGGLPAVVPWALEIDLKWGLLLPLVTIACCVAMLHSGLGRLEAAHRRRWRGIRVLWCLVVALPAVLPALWSSDGLAPGASLRNRMILYAITTLSSLVLPVTLSILAPTLLLLISMLLAGAAAVPGRAAILLQSTTDAVELCACGALLLLAALLYGLAYPPPWARSPTAEWR